MESAAYVRVCGVDVPIYVGTAKDNENLAGAWGCFEPEDCCIWLHKGMPAQLVEPILTHETLHALINLAGVAFELDPAFGIKPGDSRIAPWEEAFVRRLVPHIVETFGPPYAKPADRPKRQRKKAAHPSQKKPSRRGKRASR